MDTSEATDIAWQSIEKKQRPAPGLFKTLSEPQAYEVQMAVLSRYLARGDTLAGWKIGGNSPFGRKIFGADSLFAGFLLGSGAYTSGQSFSLDELPGPALIESEVLVTFNQRLSGVITREQALDSIGSLNASFEIAVSKLGAPVDKAQLCADNAAQWGYVLGEPIPFGRQFSFPDVVVEGVRNGNRYERALAKDKVDHQVDGIIWLAAHLGRLGQAIEPGHKLLSGSCLAPAQVEPGDVWKSTFNDGPSVAAAFI